MNVLSGFSRAASAGAPMGAPPGCPTDSGQTADTISVERRFDHRYLTGLGLTAVPVRVTDLARPERTGEGRMNDISESGMGVSAPFELAAGDVVQIEVEDSRLFGFVVHASPEDSGWRAGVELQRVLIGGSQLSAVLNRTLQRALPELPGVSAGTLRV